LGDEWKTAVVSLRVGGGFLFLVKIIKKRSFSRCFEDLFHLKINQISQWVSSLTEVAQFHDSIVCFRLFSFPGDRYNIHSQLEHLQSKYVGTGHADTLKWEWLTNVSPLNPTKSLQLLMNPPTDQQRFARQLPRSLRPALILCHR
jgi:hypothetical protein